MSKQPPRHTGQCPNCETAFRGHFCPNCGQKHATRLPGIGEYLHELSDQYLSSDGKLWRSLWLLVTRPGFLTLEYIAGRRQRYIAPARLYLMFSLLFFLALSFTPATDLQISIDSPASTPAAPRTATAPVPDAVAKPETPARAGSKDEEMDPARARQIGRQVKDNLGNFGPYAMFLMLPVYAAISALAFRRRSRPYAVHLLLALHAHSIGFLVLLLQLVAPIWIEVWLSLGLLLWLWLSLRCVFGGRWWALGLRLVFIGLVYFIVLTMTTVAGVGLTALSMS